MEECQKCHMPLGEDGACPCNPEFCYHCCECSEDCDCGCHNKK